METDRSLAGTEAFSACLDSVDLGIALVDRSSVLLFANATLRRYEKLGGFSIGTSLHFRDRRIESAIVAAITAVTSDAACFAREPCVVRAHATDDRIAPFVISIAAAARETAMLLFGIASEKRVVNRARLEAAFGLSRAETSIALALLDGCDVAEIAHRSRVSRETVRTHLRRLFEKTQTGRQSQLILALHAVGALTRSGDDADLGAS